MLYYNCQREINKKERKDKRMFKEIDKMQDKIIDILGMENALNAILKAMNYTEKKEIFEYIIQIYDLDEEEF